MNLYALLAATGGACWLKFDGTSVGLAVAVLTALGGPLIEVGLVHGPALLNLPALYEYAQPDLPRLGIDGWIAPVYFAGAPAVGGLARWAKSDLLKQ
ncbi:hypothetical protein T492DRAFT_873745 [Pavlovales sp. CCMP2436]|nr:hypothetical protein T492DRAFT_873745 [Pavlovales sp. CCMP2436]